MENSYGLVIGIANYKNLNRLPATILKDAQDIYDLLIQPFFCGYPEQNVKLLLDEEATQSGMIEALTNLSKITNADSTVFIYYSGHGGLIESGSLAGEYLLPIDCSTQLITQTAISGTQFTEALRVIPARKVIVIFDCCHAGGIGQPKDATDGIFKSGFPDEYYDQLTKGRGRVILAASRGTELSWVLPSDANSLFTKHLLGGLKGGIPCSDGLIRIFDLFEYLQPKVTAEKSIQHPVFKADIEENFPISLYLGGQKGVTLTVEEEFRYDAYISYVDEHPDSPWVWDILVPRLEEAGLKIAVSEDVALPGVARVVNMERGIKFAKRTLVVLSNLYLANTTAEFENVLAQTMGIEEAAARLLPLEKDAVDLVNLPYRLKMLSTVKLNHPRRAEREWQRLIDNLKQPLPRRTSDGVYS